MEPPLLAVTPPLAEFPPALALLPPELLGSVPDPPPQPSGSSIVASSVIRALWELIEGTLLRDPNQSYGCACGATTALVVV